MLYSVILLSMTVYSIGYLGLEGLTSLYPNMWSLECSFMVLTMERHIYHECIFLALTLIICPSTRIGYLVLCFFNILNPPKYSVFGKYIFFFLFLTYVIFHPFPQVVIPLLCATPARHWRVRLRYCVTAHHFQNRQQHPVKKPDIGRFAPGATGGFVLLDAVGGFIL